MNEVYVPFLPQAIYYMENYQRPPWRGCRGKTLLEILGKCSAGNKCGICTFAKKCAEKYDNLINSDEVKNWKETVRHVTRYYK